MVTLPPVSPEFDKMTSSLGLTAMGAAIQYSVKPLTMQMRLVVCTIRDQLGDFFLPQPHWQPIRRFSDNVLRVPAPRIHNYIAIIR